MNKPIIGTNFPSKCAAENLAASLQMMVDAGFDCVEFKLSTFPLISSGEVMWPFVAYVKNIFQKFPLRYTAHIGNGLELRNTHELDLQKRVLKASIDICQALSIDILTLHFEQASLFYDRERAFLEGHIAAADYAASLGITLCIENIEIEHHTKVLAMIDQVNRPNFAMTLDTGHLALASAYFGYDFIKAVQECAPYVRHLHVNDNTLTFEAMRLTDFPLYRTLQMEYRIAFGRGDTHLPPFWGKIPLQEVLGILNRADYRGLFICEYQNDLYVPFNQSIQANTRNVITEIFRQQ